MKILENDIAVVEGDTNISRWCEDSGRIDHDPAIREHILPLIKPDFVVVDGGANIGTHCVMYAQVALKGTILAFEPNPVAYECLLHNTRHQPNVICHKAGLADDYMAVELNHDCTNVGGSYLMKRPGPAVCVPLDKFSLSRLDFFKLDVEGWELFVLKGAESTIRRCRPTMVIEMNNGTLTRCGTTFSDILGFLGAMGYQCRSLAENFDLLNEPQYDLLATPKTA